MFSIFKMIATAGKRLVVRASLVQPDVLSLSWEDLTISNSVKEPGRIRASN
jgi:hypothetical protein